MITKAVQKCILATFSLLVILYSSSFAVQASVIKTSDQNGPQDNWRPQSPKIVLAFAFARSEATLEYAQQFERLALPPAIEKITHYSTTAMEAVQYLQDPSTLAFFYVGHSFSDQRDRLATLLDASFRPLPTNFISSATPSLRVLGLFGCNGPDIMRAYQVQYELARLPGHQLAFVPDYRFLTTSKTGFLRDRLKHSLADVFSELSTIDFDIGKPVDRRTVRLELDIQDVRSGLEVRYVSINGHIVGTIGSNEEDSNYADETKTLAFEVPGWLIRTDGPQTVKVIGAEQSSGAIIDDYLVLRVAIPSLNLEKKYPLPLHFGDDAEGGIVTMDQVNLKSRLQQVHNLQEVFPLLKAFEWMGTSPHWPSLKARFFLETL